MAPPLPSVFSAARASLYSMAGALAVVLPGWLHGARPDFTWAGLAAVAAAAGASSRLGQEFLRCLLVIGLGLTADFSRIPPLAMATLCGGGSRDLLATLQEHLYLFPAASGAMLLMVLPQRRGRPPALWLLLLIGDCLAMLLAMPLAMGVLRAVSASLYLRWSPEAWACAMALGMVGYLACRRLQIRLKAGRA